MRRKDVKIVTMVKFNVQMDDFDMGKIVAISRSIANAKI